MHKGKLLPPMKRTKAGHHAAKRHSSKFFASGPNMAGDCTLVGLPMIVIQPGLEVIKFEDRLRLKIKHNDWLLADTCPQAANHCALFGV